MYNIFEKERIRGRDKSGERERMKYYEGKAIGDRRHEIGEGIKDNEGRLGKESKRQKRMKR